jgi:hypothetical protein
MTGTLLATLLLFTPVRTAETVPAGRTMLHLDGGLALLRIDIPALPIAPVLTLDLELAHGVTDYLDLRARYTTHLGLVHRLGPEARVGLFDASGRSLAVRVYPSAQLVGTGQDDELDLGGDVSTLFGALATQRIADVAVTLEAGVTVQWLLFENLDGRTHTDTDPYLAFVELALGIEWATSPDTNLAVQLEAAVPTAPDDPFTVLGLYPRLTLGGSFAP